MVKRLNVFRGRVAGLIGFHEKVFKLKLVCFVVRPIGIVLPCGLGFGPGLDPKLAIIGLEDGTLPSGYRSR